MEGVDWLKVVKGHSLIPSSPVLPSCITLHVAALDKVSGAEVTCRVDGAAQCQVMAALDLAGPIIGRVSAPGDLPLTRCHEGVPEVILQGCFPY